MRIEFLENFLFLIEKLLIRNLYNKMIKEAKRKFYKFIENRIGKKKQIAVLCLPKNEMSILVGSNIFFRVVYCRIQLIKRHFSSCFFLFVDNFHFPFTVLNISCLLFFCDLGKTNCLFVCKITYALRMKVLKVIINNTKAIIKAVNFVKGKVT